MRATYIAAAIVAFSGFAQAQSMLDYSANAMMPGCTEAMTSSGQAFSAGYCLGVIRGLSTVSRAFKACLPAGVSGSQSLRVVVAFINQNPARMHEPFEHLVIEALRGAWPCQN